MIRKIIWLLPLSIYSILLFGCVATSDQLNGDVVSAGYQALRNGNIALLDAYIMDEDKYRKLQDVQADIQRRGENVVNESIKQAAADAHSTLRTSFSTTSNLLGDLGFSWGDAKLQRVLVANTLPGRSTEWIDYSADNTDTRLNIIYCIQSQGNMAEIELRDVFLVEGKRYLGRGLYFSAFKPKEAAADEVWRLVTMHHLNSYLGGCY